MTEITCIKDRDASLFYLSLQTLPEINVDVARQVDDYLDSPGLSLESFNVHNRLLDGCKMIHIAKQQNWKK